MCFDVKISKLKEDFFTVLFLKNLTFFINQVNAIPFFRFSNKIFTLKYHLPQKQIFSENLIEDLSRFSPPNISNRHIHFHDN